MASKQNNTKNKKHTNLVENLKEISVLHHDNIAL
jgi:hypothetical protein